MRISKLLSKYQLSETTSILLLLPLTLKELKVLLSPNLLPAVKKSRISTHSKEVVTTGSRDNVRLSQLDCIVILKTTLTTST